MKTTVRIEGEVTEDGHLLVDLPVEMPHGRVVVTLEPLLDDDLELTDEDLRGAGLTAEEIASSPEIGAWQTSEARNGAEYVEEVRGASPRYPW